MMHPLDPLSPAEITSAADIVKAKGRLSGKAWYETIALEEPLKQALEFYDQTGKIPPRAAYVCCYDPATNQTWAGLADLEAGALKNWKQEKGMQARIGIDEFVAGGNAAIADPDFITACAKRGITDMGMVLVEPWAAGNFGFKNEEGRRIAVGHCWVRNAAGDNPYARPIANLHPIIDLQHMKVIRVDDFGLVPLPPDSTPIKSKEQRTDLKPLVITQPEGASFSVEGQLVKWQKWQFRVHFHPRDGLVLQTIGYEDKGRVRPIIHRASLSEMVVPYGDPRANYYRRNAFDTGEYGIGQLTDSLVLGCDCLGHIHYFDAWFHDWTGTPKHIKNAICMHEEDFGTLWKFTNTYHHDVTVKRSRRLAVSSIATIGNYVYGFFWYFYQDGTIGVEVKATGIPLAQSHPVGLPPPYGAEVAPGIDAPVHQHIFSYRFDMAVDGHKNSVAEVNFAKMKKGPRNRHGNAMAIRETVFSDESKAAREMDFGSARYWKVFNAKSKNAIGNPVAYKLVPGVNALPFLDKSAPVSKRAGFMFKHFWATQFASDELYAAGQFPNQHKGGDGLPKWVKKRRSLKQKNVVVWYTMNYHHLPRPEDMPVQPVVYANFHWMPFGFFDVNPALDVPSPEAASCCG